jgi:hypothetical protein
LWLTAVCGILLVWWQDHGRLRADLDGWTKDATERRAEIERLQVEADELRAAVIEEREQLQEATNMTVRRQRTSNWLATIVNGAPIVTGLVSAVHKREATVEINLGTDHGLKLGDTLDVYRLGNTLATTRYLGQIRLTSADKTSAVGTVQPNAKGTIQENDHVSVSVK